MTEPVFIKGKYYIGYRKPTPKGKYWVYGIGYTVEDAIRNLESKI